MQPDNDPDVIAASPRAAEPIQATLSAIARAISRISRNHLGSSSADEIARVVVDEARELFHADSSALYIFDTVQQALHPLADNDPRRLRTNMHLPQGQGVAWYAYSQRRPFWVNDYLAWDGALPFLKQQRVRDAILAVPLGDQESPFGVINIRITKPHVWDDDTIHGLTLYAELVGPLFKPEDRAAYQAHWNEKMATLVESMGCGVFVTAASGEPLIYANRAARTMLGTAPTKSGLPGPESLLDEDGRRVGYDRSPVRQASATGEPVLKWVLGREKEGEFRWFEGDSIPVAGENGLQLIITAFVDVTDRKRASDALSASERRFRSLIENASDAVVILDQSVMLLYASPAVGRLTGLNPSDLLPGRSLDWVVAEDRASLKAAIAVLELQPDRRHLQRIRYMHSDGTERIGEAVLTNCLADDSVGGIVVNLRDVTEQVRAHERLAYEAKHDSLTGLPNRQRLHEEMAVELADVSSDSRLGVALLLIRIEQMREVVVTFGHQFADGLLKQVGPRIESALKHPHFVARLGGDDFAVLLPAQRKDRMPIEQSVAGILRAIDAPFMVEGYGLMVGARMGIAVAPDHAFESSALLRCADAALYGATRAGDASAIYAQHLDSHSPELLTLTADLRQAIEGNELALVYQPKVAFTADKELYVEALARWNHPTRGYVSPEIFVALAENNGLIRPLTRWAISTALQQLHSWRQRGLNLRAAVNISTRDLLDPDFPQMLAGILKENAVDASALTLELTETAVMANITGPAQILGRLKDMGISLAIDDFGTGYSSLARLRHLPVSELKIDKSFVLGMNKREADMVIVRSTIDLGHNLGLSVTAEGIETPDILAMLDSLGCDRAQGYLLARPLSPSDLEAWMSSRSPKESHSSGTV